MPLYSFQLAAHLAGRAVSVTAAGVSDVVASGTLDSDAKFSAELPVGDYVATAGTGYYRHSSAGTVDLGDRDGVLTSGNADTAIATAVNSSGSQTRAALSSTFATQQADYVDLLRTRSRMNRLQVTKKAAGTGATFEVVAYNNTEHVTSTFNSEDGDKYRRIWETWAGAVTRSFVSTGLYRYSAVTTTGTWSAAADAVAYTTAVGATFSIVLPVPEGGAVALRTYKDNRGGIWNLSLAAAGAATRTATLSTFNASVATITSTVFTDLPAGTYTLTGTFAGDDPANAPSGGVSRGWLGRNYAAGTDLDGYNVHVQTPGAVTAARTTKLSPVSNWDIAIYLAPTLAGAPEWVPEHAATLPTVKVENVKFYNGGRSLDMDAMANGETVQINDFFDVVQHVYWRHTASGTTNLLEAWTSQRFYPDGRVVVTGKWKALQNVYVTKGYVLMLPADSGAFDTLVSSTGTQLPHTAAEYGTRRYVDGAAKSWVALSSANDYALAVTYENRPETLRFGQPGKPAAAVAAFIESDVAKAKVYQPLWDENTVTLVPAGAVHRYQGAFIRTKVPNVHSLLTVS